MLLDLQRQLGIDASFFTQFVIFLLIFAWLQIVYFRPYLALIQQREGKSGGMSEEAAKLEEAADRAEAEYRDILTATRRRAAGEREKVLAEARHQANEIVNNARSQSKAKLEQAREASARSAEAELASLKGQVGSVATMLVEKLTKTKVGL